MRRFTFAIALACLAIAFAGCAGKKEPQDAAPTTASVAAPPMVEATATSLNIRATADAKGAVVGTLKKGELATAPQPAANGWQYVESSTGAKGYVAAQYVRSVAADSTATPAAAPAAAPTTTAAPAEKAESAQGEVSTKPAPPGSKLAKVTKGMTEAQVIAILGAPTTQKSYVTGKMFIPFYFGSDKSRLEYHYKGVGIVVFTRNSYSGGTEVMRVDYDPNEDGVP